MILLLLFVVFLMPQAVFAVLSHEVSAALIAGIFSVVNTLLTFKILKQVGVANSNIDTANQQIGATKKAARQGSDALLEIAEVRKKDKHKNGEHHQ